VISVICPMLNEMNFAEAWVYNVRRYADEIIVVDMGSTDGTLDVLKRHKIHLYQWPQQFAPYRWTEGDIRNWMIRQCTHKWIVNQDADELWGEDFFDSLDKLTASSRTFHRFTQLAFWHTPFTIRHRQFGHNQSWRRFYPAGRQLRMFRNNEIVYYSPTGNHATLGFFGLKGTWRLSASEHDIPFFHYHRILPTKEGGNRSEEWKASGIRLETYFGPHPVETEHYKWWR